MAFNLAGLKLDAYDYDVREISKDYDIGLDKLAGDVQLMTEEQLKLVPDERFALVMLKESGQKIRKWNLADMPHVKLSCYYFLNNMDKMPEQLQKAAAYHIKAAYERFGTISPRQINEIAGEDFISNIIDLGHVREKVATTILDRKKSLDSLEDSDFAHTMKEGAITRRKFAMDSTENLSVSIFQFLNDNDTLKDFERIKVATLLSQRCKYFGVDTPEPIEKMARCDYSWGMKAAFAKRASMVDLEHRRQLEFIQKQADTENPLHLVETLEVFDRANDLEKLYNKGLDTPFESIIGREKTAQIRVGNRVIGDEALEEIKKTANLKDLIGEEKAASWETEPGKTFSDLDPAMQMLLINKYVRN